MKKLQLKTIFLVTTLSLLAACSSKPKGPVDDEYITEPFVWDDNKSEALNLLRSADLQKYFKDVDSEDDFDEVRYRKSTAKSVFDYVGGFMAFGIAGVLNNNANHEDDDNPKFRTSLYVTYIGVDKKDLNNIEQANVRNKAVARMSSLVNTKVNVKPWRVSLDSRFYLDYSGETCDFMKGLYTNTSMEGVCRISDFVTITKVIKSSNVNFLTNSSSEWVAVVKVALPAPTVAISVAKNVDRNSFVAFLDSSKTYDSYIKTAFPVVATYDKALFFLSPKKRELTNLEHRKIEAVMCAVKTSNCYITSIITDDKTPLLKTKVVAKK